MKPQFKTYLRIILISGFSFALLNSGMDYLFNFDFYLWRFVLNILFFGGLMAIFLGGWNTNERNRNGLKEYTEENSKLRYDKIIESTISKEQLLEGIKEEPYFTKFKLIDMGNVIEMNSKKSFVSWGETIIIEIKEIDDTINKFRVLCKPKVVTTVTDGGANYINMKKIEGIFLKNIR